MTMPDTGEIAREIVNIHKKYPQHSALLIEKYLDNTLNGCSVEQKLKYLNSLKSFFGQNDNLASAPVSQPEHELILHFCHLLLGKNFTTEELASEELLDRLTHSLNTVFDTLNQLVLLIDTTLLNENQKKETIRHIIGFQMDGDTPARSLEEYLNQIKIAFLTSHQAFKNAAYNVTDKILSELAPSRMDDKKDKSFKIGLLHKAEKFEKYEQIFTNCKKWFDSGRFMEEFQREFEKNCQKLSFQQRR